MNLDMGTNPKRTVTVQMDVDAQGNKEPNANWTTEPNLQLSQVCPNPTVTFPNNQQDNSSPAAAHTDIVPHPQKTKGGDSVSGKPVPANGNMAESEHVTSGDRPLPGRGVAEPGGDGRDSNANMKTLSLGDEKDIGTAGVPSAAAASAVDIQASARRIKGPTQEVCGQTASVREDNYTHVSPNNNNRNDACELRQAASAQPQENKGCISAPKNKETAVGQKSREPGHLQSSTRSSVSLQETPKPDKSPETQTPFGSTAPPPVGKTAEERSTNKNEKTPSEQEVQPETKPHVLSEKHQPVSSQMAPSAPPQATHNTQAQGQVAEGARRTGTAVVEGQRQLPCSLYREASTMTSSPSSTPVKRCQDMEVQAVASTCSKAVETSPSLLPYVVSRRPSGGAAPQEEAQSLAVVYQADGGVGLQQRNVTAPSLSGDPRSERLTVEAEMCHEQNAGAALNSVSRQPDGGLGAKPREVGPAICNTQPVYQINIEHSNPKEHGETGNSQTSGLKTSAAAKAPSVKSGTPPETAGAPQAASADRKKTAPSPTADTTKPEQARPTTAAAAAAAGNTASDRAKSKAGGSKAKNKESGSKAATKESRKKTEADKNKEQDNQSGTQKDKSIHDVVWDEQGMTWEVYGASVDPESLGFAIQSHLQCKIKEQERKLVARTSLRKSIPAVESPSQGKKKKRRQQNIFRSMLRNVRRPNCCARPPPSAVLE